MRKEGKKSVETKKVIENLKALFQRVDYIRGSEGLSYLSEEDVMESVLQ